MNKRIGIVDEPNPKGASDELDIKLHATALTEFIKGCPTPITIGVQGEWGSGKTSILNSIYHDLSQEGTYKQIWINSWESSLLSTPEEALLKIINEIIDEMIDSDVEKSKQDKIKQTASTIFKGALRVGSSMVNAKVGEITEELLENKGNSIKQLRESLNALANEIMQRPSNPYKKIVIYVDDLDRIEPKEAVKILELLKNIFSITGCVFVLAIDYQVVVKGLEHKFGKRTDENEWEFRAFFDKIIQLPFMMPMGQYNIGKYVSSLLKQIGFIEHNDINDEIIETVINYSIGGNPRALKRLVNSLSLITIFLRIQAEDKKILSEKNRKSLLFTMVCIQIAYPVIYELLITNPNFLGWSQEFAYSKTRLKEEENFEKFNKEFKSAIETDDFDEEWEQALFRICYSTPRYYKRVTDISRLLTYINDNILKDEKAELEEIIAEVISETSVTSVAATDDTQTNVKKHQKVKFDDFESYKENILIKYNIEENIINLIKTAMELIQNKLQDKCLIKYSPTFIGLNIETTGREKVFCGLHIRKKYITASQMYISESELLEVLGENFDVVNSNFTLQSQNKKLTRWELKPVRNIEDFEKYLLPILIRSCESFIRDFKK